MDRLKAAWAAIQRTSAWRAWKRYGDARGNLLAGGVTYFAFFSIFPAVALAFTIFGVLLQGHPEWLDQVRAYLDETLPGFVKDGNEGLIPLQAPKGSTLSVTGVLGLLGLLWAGLGWLGALRDGIRAVFGTPGEPGNLLTNKLRDLGVLVLLGFAIVVSAGVTGVAGAAATWVAGLVGMADQWWVLKVITVLVGVLLDGAIVLVMLRLLSGVDVPWRGLRNGALAGGIGLTVLKLLGTTLLGAMRNPLFASIALVVGLLVWLNLMSRVVLISSAWAANELDEEHSISLSAGVQHKLAEGPPAPADLAAAGDEAVPGATGVRAMPAVAASDDERPVGQRDVDQWGVDQRAVDRVSVVSGAIAGAGAAAGAGLLAGILRRRRRSGGRHGLKSG